MPALPVISGAQAARAFRQAGWEIARQRGSHIILTRPGSIVSLSVPNHDPIARGTLRSLIRDADLTVEQFIALL